AAGILATAAELVAARPRPLGVLCRGALRRGRIRGGAARQLDLESGRRRRTDRMVRTSASLTVALHLGNRPRSAARQSTLVLRGGNNRCHARVDCLLAGARLALVPRIPAADRRSSLDGAGARARLWAQGGDQPFDGSGRPLPRRLDAGATVAGGALRPAVA